MSYWDELLKNGVPQDIEKTHFSTWENTLRLIDMLCFVPKAEMFIIEFGGGDLKMANILKTTTNVAYYTVIDLPSMLEFQKNKMIRTVELCTLSDMVNRSSDPKTEPKVFMSFWALSETYTETIDKVFEKNFFDADYIAITLDLSNKEHEESTKYLIYKLMDKFGSRLKKNEIQWLHDGNYLLEIHR